MKHPENPRECPECSEKLIGRSDKKFCSDACRSAFNNRRQTKNNGYIKSVNRILLKNHSILHKLNPNGTKTVVDKSKLISMGFQLSYHTHAFSNQKGATYYFCYDQGYLMLSDPQKFLLVKQKVI